MPRVVQAASEVAAEAWDMLVGPNDPLNLHAFHVALEASGTVAPERGWLPQHLVFSARELGLRDDEAPACILPVYLKSHSYGEYIFDWGLAEAWQRLGRAFYPKLVAMVPYTPATSARWLGTLPDFALLEQALLTLAEDRGAHAIQLLYLDAAECEHAQSKRWITRAGLQFQYLNEGGDADFEAHLARMRSRHRKQVRKERAQAAQHGLVLGVEAGSELSDADCAHIYDCYSITCDERGAPRYLLPEFFAELNRSLAPSVRAATARRESGDIVACALAYHAGAQLYGRHWGVLEEGLGGLHFELCYHRLLAWGLAHGVQRFESGAQGHHKLKRGFLPRLTRSLYWFRDPQLHAFAKRYFCEEAAALEHERLRLLEDSPFSAAGPR